MSTTGSATAAATGHRPRSARRWLWLALALLLQVGLGAAAVAPQLAARAVGAEYRLRVAPVDPIDPFRGAYVTLDYPDLARPGIPEDTVPGSGTVFVTLQERDGLWRGASFGDRPPAQGPYLRCRDEGWRLRCGIESWFVPQDRAAQLEEAVRGGHAVAVVRVDDRGDAAIVDLLTDSR